MALIKCPECGKEISDKAIACPNCGNPMNQQAQQEEYLCCPKCGSRVRIPTGSLSQGTAIKAVFFYH